MEDRNDPQQSLPGERQWLRSALLADQDGLLTATRQRLTRIARARGIEAHLVDDVIQETLLEAWSHLDRLYAPAGFPAWIDEICRNVCRRSVHRSQLDAQRNISLVPESAAMEANSNDEEMFVADVPDPLEELSRQDMLVLLDRALGLLPSSARQLVEMNYLLELPHQEIAAQLKLSSTALDVRLHRARREMHKILHGPLHDQSIAMGLRLDEALVEGWQTTRLWCPLCGSHRLEGCFVETNLHLRCPDCSRRYGQDTVHSMGLIQLSGLQSFRPAWKRTMQGVTDRFVCALLKGQDTCLYCGQTASVRVVTNPEAHPYPFGIRMSCDHCGHNFDGCGNLPSIDQLVYWSAPEPRQFVLEHPRWTSAPPDLVEYQNQPAFHFKLMDLESSDHVSVVADRQTLRIITIA